MLALVSLALASGARAQHLRPSDTRPEPPPLPSAPTEAAPLRLPPIPPTRAREGAASGERILVRAFRIEGATAIPTDDLAEVLAPYVGRELGAEDLVDVRDAVTRLYQSRGYVGSTATIPAQSVSDGTVDVRVQEGRLGTVSVEGTDRLRPGFVRSRLEWAGRAPVNVNALERELQVLQQDPQIARLHAELRPGARAGEVDLDVRIEEAPPTWVELRGANDQSAAIGGSAGSLSLERRGLTGGGDVLVATVEAGRGLGDYEGTYSIPVHPSDTTLDLRVQHTRSHVVEQPFDDLDIESEYSGYGAGLRQPLWRDANRQLWLGVFLERRRSETSLLGEPFGFGPGHEDGVTRLDVARFFADWTWRTQEQVFALRGTISTGTDLDGGSNFPEDIPGVDYPDEHFVVGLAQAQWIRQVPLPISGSQLVGRFDLQLTGDKLVSLEQFALGGSRTVRGYPESEFVRDQGFVGSLELRVPILRTIRGEDLLQIAPFVDYGQSWNVGTTYGPQGIGSVGVGLRWRPFEGMLLAGYWGARLRDVPEPDNDLQRAGISLEARITRAF